MQTKRQYISLLLLWSAASRYYTSYMNTEQTLQITTTSLQATIELGAVIGRNLRGGETIALASDLGGGKTALVTGLAQGAGSVAQVSSPSFTLSNQYTAGDLTIHHFDFYRLDDPGIMVRELAEVIDYPDAVVVIEWAEIVDSILPTQALRIRISAKDEDAREFKMNYPIDMQ